MARILSFAGILLACTFLASCGQSPAANETGEHAAVAAADSERGPHRGRLLRAGDFAIEMTIFEDGVEPEFPVYAYRDDKPVPPAQIQPSAHLTRLAGRVDRVAFPTKEGVL